MNELDLKILRALAKDSQESFLSIAKKLGVSPKTVQSRYDRMVENQTIIQCSILVDLSKLGYQGKAYLLISLEQGYKKEKIAARLREKENVFLVTEVMGGACDIIAVAAIKNFHDIIKLILSIKSLSGVSEVNVDLADETMFPINSSFNSLIQH